MQENPTASTREVALLLGCGNTTVDQHLTRLGYRKVLSTWTPHALSDSRHLATFTRDTLATLGWEVLPHPPYSPDLAPSDYHLFAPLQNFLKGKQLKKQRDIEMEVERFFARQSQQFWADGIGKLPDR